MSSQVAANTRASRVKKKKVPDTPAPSFDPYEILKSTKLCSREVHQRKKNCIANPRCIFGLGDANEGIWHKDAKQVFLQRHLGIDLHDQSRKSCSSPACKAPVGLKNLGATCYLNALIQCLYHNVPIRNAILNIDTKELAPTTKDMLHELTYNDRSTRVLDALQMTFTHLNNSNQSVYNLDIVTDLLGLNTGEQQDLHELSSLLIAKIESTETLKLGKIDSTLSSISQLMNGVQKFSVTCQKCRHVSSREEAFCELDLAVEGQKSISDSLLHYFREELLDGDNRYECAMCNSRQDAIRTTEIVKTPPVLFVQLRRNIYDMKTYQKIKLKTSITIPPELSILDDTYQLSAVVYHRGASAYGGHYITEVLNWEEDKWWLCDDSTVLHSPNGPCKATEKAKVAKKDVSVVEEGVADLTQDDDGDGDGDENEVTQVEMVVEEEQKDDTIRSERLTRRGRGRGPDSLQTLSTPSPALAVSASTVTTDLNPEQDDPSSTKSRNIAKKEKEKQTEEAKGGESANSLLRADAIKEYEHANKLNRSKDVYMLLYVKQEVILPAPSSSVVASRSKESTRGKTPKHSQRDCLVLNRTPEFLWKRNHKLAVLQKNEIFSTQLAKYLECAAKVENEIETRKSDFKSFELLCDANELDKLGVEVDAEKYFLVPTVWLRSWITGQVVASSSVALKTDPSKYHASNVCDLTDESTSVPSAASTAGEDMLNLSGGLDEASTKEPQAHCLFSRAISNRPYVCPHSRSYQHPDDGALAAALASQDNTTSDYISPSAIIEHFKLVPNAAYEILMESIRRKDGNSFSECIDFEFTNYNVRCDICCSIEMSNKDCLTDTHGKYLELLKLLNGGPSSDGSGDDDGDGHVPGRHYIEKKWITWLKKRADGLQKELSGRKLQLKKSKNISQFFQPLVKSSIPGKTAVSREVVLLDDDDDSGGCGGGVSVAVKKDGIDSTCVCSDVADGTGTVVSEPLEDDKEEQEDGDSPLNQALICHHDMLVPGYQRRVKHISLCAWLALLDLFPDSVPIITAEVSSEDARGSGVESAKERWRGKRKRGRGKDAVDGVNDVYVDVVVIEDEADMDEEDADEQAQSSTSPSPQPVRCLPGVRAECVRCVEESLLQKELLQDKQMARKVERSGDNKCLSDLARRVTCFSMAPLDTSLNYFLVEGLWLQQWRAYTLDTHGAVERPPMLTNESLRCSHGGVNLPRMLLDKLKSSSEDVFSVDSLSYNMSKNVDSFLPTEAPICELVTEEQWTALENLGYHQGRDSESLVEVYCAAMPDSVSFTCTRRSSFEGNGNNGSGHNGVGDGDDDDDDEGGAVSWKCIPEQCAVCASSIQEQRTLHRTYFQNKPIQVVELSSLDALSAIQSGSEEGGGTPMASTPRSTRSSRSSHKRGGKKQLEVSSDDILAMLSLKIYELWPRARPLQQQIYSSSGVLLEGHHKTLESLGVLASCTLYVIVNYGQTTPSEKKKHSSKSSSSKKRQRGDNNIGDEEESEQLEADENNADDGGEAEMWQIVSIHASGGYGHVSGSGTGGDGDGTSRDLAGEEDNDVTDLTTPSSSEKCGDGEKKTSNKKKKASEDGFMGTFLMSGHH